MKRFQAFQHVAPTAMAAALAGCRHAPMVDIGGSYFPSWMLCLSISIACAIGVRGVLRYRALEEQISLLALFYPVFVLLLSCLLWLLLFR